MDNFFHFLAQKDCIFTHVYFNFSEKYGNRVFSLAQSLSKMETSFNWSLGLQNQTTVRVKNFSIAEFLSPMQIPQLSKDEDEQVKMVHKGDHVMGLPNTKIAVYLWPYRVENPHTS